MEALAQVQKSPLPVAPLLKGPSILLVTGEASGDHHCANIVQYLKDLLPQAHIFGMGGSALRAAGMETVVDSETSASVMGVTELAGTIGKLLTAFRLLLTEIDKRKPSIAVLVDFPDFNLRLARKLSRRNIPVIYFISPQVWAWRKGRIRQMRKYVTKIACIFPFEESFYQAHGVNAEYVGHPFLEMPFVKVDRRQFLLDHGLDPDRPVIALLPGSRESEVERLFPTMLQAFTRLCTIRPGVQALVPVAPTLSLKNMRRMVEDVSGVTLVVGQARQVLTSVDAAVVSSGTATVEAAFAAVPFVVIYKMSSLTYRLGKLLVRGVKYIAMVNILGRSQIVRELLQDQATPTAIVEELEHLLGDKQYREKMLHQLAHVRKSLEGDQKKIPSRRVAEMILEVVGSG